MEVVEPEKAAVLQNRFFHYVYTMEAINYLQGLLYPEDGGSRLLQNTVTYLSNFSTYYTR